MSIPEVQIYILHAAGELGNQGNSQSSICVRTGDTDLVSAGQSSLYNELDIENTMLLYHI